MIIFEEERPLRDKRLSVFDCAYCFQENLGGFVQILARDCQRGHESQDITVATAEDHYNPDYSFPSEFSVVKD